MKNYRIWWPNAGKGTSDPYWRIYTVKWQIHNEQDGKTTLQNRVPSPTGPLQIEPYIMERLNKPTVIKAGQSNNFITLESESAQNVQIYHFLVLQTSFWLQRLLTYIIKNIIHNFNESI